MKISTIFILTFLFFQLGFTANAISDLPVGIYHYSPKNYFLIKNAKQSSDTLLQNKHSLSNRFLLRSLAISFSNFRDYATSPLFYPGTGLSFGYGWLNSSFKRNRLLDVNFSSSFHSAKAPKSTYFQTDVRAFLFSLGIYYNYLFLLERISDEKTSVKFGPSFLGTQNIRLNPRLGNAASGIETIADINAAIKISREFKQSFEKNTSKNISFQLDAAVLNFNHRPDYTYVSVGEFGSGLEELKNLIESYRWSINGWRLGTRLDYSWYSPNGNGRKLTYTWDAAHIPGKFEKLQFATHRIGYSIIINNNKD